MTPKLHELILNLMQEIDNLEEQLAERKVYADTQYDYGYQTGYKVGFDEGRDRERYGDGESYVGWDRC